MPVARPRPDRHPRRGAVVHWLVASRVILTIVALGLDGGRSMEARRHGQAIADAAALAAAADLYGQWSASAFNVTGGFVNTGGAIMIAPVRTGVRPTPDPLWKLAAPARGSYKLQKAAPLVINSLLPTTLNPGIYQGGIQIKGLSIVTMSP